MKSNIDTLNELKLSDIASFERGKIKDLGIDELLNKLQDIQMKIETEQKFFSNYMKDWKNYENPEKLVGNILEAPLERPQIL